MVGKDGLFWTQFNRRFWEEAGIELLDVKCWHFNGHANFKGLSNIAFCGEIKIRCFVQGHLTCGRGKAGVMGYYLCPIRHSMWYWAIANIQSKTVSCMFKQQLLFRAEVSNPSLREPPVPAAFPSCRVINCFHLVTKVPESK